MNKILKTITTALFFITTIASAQIDVDYMSNGLASPNWRDPKASSGVLPTLNNNTGDARVSVADTTVYVWNGSAWVASGGGSGSFCSLTGCTMTGTLTLDPTDQVNPNDAATIGQLTAFVAGAAWKSPGADLATTGNITLSGEQTIDGTLTAASRVLVKAQTAQDENGIYVSGAGAWVRSTDADASGELNAAAITVIGGSTLAGSSWVQITPNPTVGVSNIIFAPFGISYTAGAGLALTGNAFSIATGGIVNSMVNAAAAIDGTKISPDFGAQNVVTTGTGSFKSLSTLPSASNLGFLNLGADVTVPAGATAAGDIKIFATTAGFGGFGMKTFGGQGIEFELDQVNTQYSKIIIQDEASIIMANVPAVVGAGIVVTDGATLTSRSIDFSIDAGASVLPYANGGSNTGAAFTQGSMIFAGASSFEQDNANFFIDNASNFVGIRSVAAPVSALTIGAFPALATYPSIFNDGALTLSLSDNNGDSVVAAFENTNSIGAANIILANRPAAFTQGGTNLGGILFEGSNDAAGATTAVGAWIKAINSGTWSATSSPAHLQFETTPINTTTPVGRMRIFTTGAITMGSVITSTLGTLGVTSLSASNVGIISKGVAAQTGDLYEGVDSTGALMFRVAANGSTQGVDLRTIGTGGAGFLQLRQQTSDPSAVTNTALLYTNSAGLFTVRQGIGSNFPFSLTNSALSAARVYTLPDAAGTLGLVPSTGFVKSSGTALTSVTSIDLAADVGVSITPMANGGSGVATIAAGTVTSNGSVLSSKVDVTVKTNATQTVSTTTPTALTQLTQSLVAGTYKFSGVLVFQSTSATVGVGFKLGVGTATVSETYAKFQVGQGANGVSHDFEYDQIAIGTNSTTASVAAANTDALAYVSGTFTVTSGGTVNIEMRSETGTAVSIRSGSYVTFEAI